MVRTVRLGATTQIGDTVVAVPWKFNTDGDKYSLSVGIKDVKQRFIRQDARWDGHFSGASGVSGIGGVQGNEPTARGSTSYSA